MLYILIAALGVAVARQFSWFGVFAISTVLAVALGSRVRSTTGPC